MPLSPSQPVSQMLPPDSFADTTVMVITTGHWLSKELAASFASFGATVVAAGKDHLHGQAVVSHLPQGDHAALTMEPAHPDSVAQCFESAEQRLGPITVLINPFSEGSESPAEDLPPATWRAVTNELLNGSFFCAQELARRRIEDEAGGVIVNFATPYMATGGAGLAAWETAKAGLAHLTKSLAVEWAAFNVRVNAVAPGYLTSPDGQHALGGTLAGGRCAEAADISACVLYMCTPFAAYLTGHTFDIDGASWQRQGRLPPRFETIRSRHRRDATGKPE